MPVRVRPSVPTKRRHQGAVARFLDILASREKWRKRDRMAQNRPVTGHPGTPKPAVTPVTEAVRRPWYPRGMTNTHTDIQYLSDQLRRAHESLERLRANQPATGTDKALAWRWAVRAERDTIQLLSGELAKARLAA